jgi:hypothetical protein
LATHGKTNKGNGNSKGNTGILKAQGQDDGVKQTTAKEEADPCGMTARKASATATAAAATATATAAAAGAIRCWLLWRGGGLWLVGL